MQNALRIGGYTRSALRASLGMTAEAFPCRPSQGRCHELASDRGVSETLLAHFVRHFLMWVEPRIRSPFARQMRSLMSHCANSYQLLAGCNAPPFQGQQGAARDSPAPRRSKIRHVERSRNIALILRLWRFGRLGPPQSPSRPPALLSRRCSQPTGLLNRINAAPPQQAQGDVIRTSCCFPVIPREP